MYADAIRVGRAGGRGRLDSADGECADLVSGGDEVVDVVHVFVVFWFERDVALVESVGLRVDSTEGTEVLSIGDGYGA